MRQKHAPSGAFFMAVFALLALPARAALTIEITQAGERVAPIEVADFSGPQVGENIGAIIRRDFTRSGEFRALAPVAPAPIEGGDATEAAPPAPGPDLRIAGQVSRLPDGRYRFVYALTSAARGETLLSEAMVAGAGRWREVAHLISDHAYQRLTGVRGVFSTRLMYVQEYRQAGLRRYRLMIADLDGERQQVVLDSDQPLMAPTWAPSLRQVAYVSFEGGRPGVWLHDLATRARRLLTDFPGVAAAPAFSPDGRELAMSLSRDGNPEVYVMTLASGELRRITRHPAIDTEPRWSRDGRTLYFTSDRGGAPQIYRADSGGEGEARRVSFSGRFNARADVSPDGDSLALVHETRGQYQIAVQSLKSGVIDTLTDNPLDGSPSWAPNGRLLIYATRAGDRHVLGISAVDSRFSMRLPPVEGLVREPAWSPFLQ